MFSVSGLLMKYSTLDYAQMAGVIAQVGKSETVECVQLSDGYITELLECLRDGWLPLHIFLTFFVGVGRWA